MECVRERANERERGKGRGGKADAKRAKGE